MSARGLVRGASGGVGRLSVGPPLVVAFAVALMFASGSASAAALRSSVTVLGALAVFAALLFVREWPVALTGSLWAAGTVFAAAVWLLRSRYRPAWFAALSPAHARALPSAGRVAVAAAASDRVTWDGGDANEVLAAARRCFVDLQAAWDAEDIETMRAHTTAEMLDELLLELPLRGPGPNRTDVVSLEAELLALEEFGSRYLASVAFSGLISESTDRGAAPFKEVWMLTCDRDEMSGWRLARQQALL